VRRERKGRIFDDDLRPAVRSLAVSHHPEESSCGAPTWLRAELTTRPRGVRPRELVEALGADVMLGRARRTQQWIEHGGERWEPLSAGLGLDVAMAAHAWERAS
jgi:hypothetical protein